MRKLCKPSGKPIPPWAVPPIVYAASVPSATKSGFRMVCAAVLCHNIRKEVLRPFMSQVNWHPLPPVALRFEQVMKNIWGAELVMAGCPYCLRRFSPLGHNFFFRTECVAMLFQNIRKDVLRPFVSQVKLNPVAPAVVGFPLAARTIR